MAEAELTTPALRVIFARLDEQIRWYESHSVAHKRLYKLLKGMVIMAGALTPICAALHLSAAITGSLGVIAVVFESIQQLNQHHQNWLTYRSTGEALKHEKYLYLACAGPYAVADDAARLPLLAEPERGRARVLLGPADALHVEGSLRVPGLGRWLNVAACCVVGSLW